MEKVPSDVTLVSPSRRYHLSPCSPVGWEMMVKGILHTHYNARSCIQLWQCSCDIFVIVLYIQIWLTFLQRFSYRTRQHNIIILYGNDSHIFQIWKKWVGRAQANLVWPNKTSIHLVMGPGLLLLLNRELYKITSPWYTYLLGMFGI